ncbi:MAG: prepilin-type N-terminal cleavage/methylation domain-containing protein [Gammaproteobacteria bacterium]
MIGSKSAQGFTLIELLVAMTLLSIMMVLLFGSLRICAESWSRGEQKITDVSDVSAVVNFFQRHLTVARPLWNDFGTEVDKVGKVFSFQGKNQSLQFVSSFPASAGRAGLQLITVDLQRMGGEQALHVTLTPFFPAAEGEEWYEEDEILIKGVNRFSLSYFGSEDGLSEGRWQDEWLEKDRMPGLVKISIDLDNAIFWPEMILALKMAGSDSSDLIDDAEDESEDEDGDDDDDDDSNN